MTPFIEYHSDALARANSLSELAAVLADLPPPLVIFNKSHSGSRVLVDLIAAGGIFTGSNLNDSGDALDWMPLVEAGVDLLYPEYWRLGEEADTEAHLTALARTAVTEHLADYRGGPWGWKLCETVYILPLIDILFPAARYVHLIRDGRDVAFSNHVPPRRDFWRRIYVNSARLRFWNGLVFGKHSRTAYRLYPHLFNAQHWHNSVTVGRRFGAMLGRRYQEIRYEDLCAKPHQTAARLFAFAGIESSAAALAPVIARIRMDRVGRYLRHNRLSVWQVTRRLRPLLVELGYL